MARASKDKFDPRLFTLLSHRGLHDEQSTENGLSAFEKSIDEGLPFELDVHLTLDGGLIVCHDSELKRTTGKQGIIEEMTLEQIGEYRLLDGGKVPTLDDVLALNDERVPIVIELKTYKNNGKPLAKKLLQRLSSIRDKKTIALISFDPRALYWCKHCPFMRGLLVGTGKKWILMFRNMFEFLCPDQVLLDDSRVSSYRKKGGILDTWTLESEQAIEKAAEKADILTYQHVSREARDRLRNR